MHLFQIAFLFKVNWRAGARRHVRRSFLRWPVSLAKFVFHEFQNLLVGDISRGGNHQVIGREPTWQNESSIFFG